MSAAALAHGPWCSRVDLSLSQRDAGPSGVPGCVRGDRCTAEDAEPSACAVRCGMCRVRSCCFGDMEQQVTRRVSSLRAGAWLRVAGEPSR